jgi:hypothetical protein
MAKLNEHLTVGLAADLLGGGKDILRRWDRAGKLNARRHLIIGCRLYLPEDLAALLRQIAQEDSARMGLPKARQQAW